MPLMTQIIRKGEPLELRWGFWHLNCIAKALDEEGVEGGFPSSYTFQNSYEFTDPADGEVFTLKAGDEVLMHR
jgi:hypothetical protein